MNAYFGMPPELIPPFFSVPVAAATASFHPSQKPPLFMSGASAWQRLGATALKLCERAPINREIWSRSLKRPKLQFPPLHNRDNTGYGTKLFPGLSEMTDGKGLLSTGPGTKNCSLLL